jgi:isochorismate synthase
MEFLRANEGYDRQFYSGFLGPVNFRNESHIYVNLRCFQIQHKKAVVYAGAGVTIDSVPENEWEETEMKLDTLSTFFT